MLKNKGSGARVSVEQNAEDHLDEVVTGVRIFVERASEEITDTVKNEVGKVVEKQTEHIAVVDNGIEKLSNGQEAVLGAVDNMVNYMRDEVTTATENAKKHERISFQVRGQLGAEARKHRRADLEEIAVLKRENMALTQSIIEKDKAAAALAAGSTAEMTALKTEVAALKAEMVAMRAGTVVMKASFDALVIELVNQSRRRRRRV